MSAIGLPLNSYDVVATYAGDSNLAPISQTIVSSAPITLP